jgi:replicative DNA helicase
MANWELQLISSIVKAPDRSEVYSEVLKEGVCFKMFGTPQARSLWASIEAYYSRPNNFGHIPSEQTLLEGNPNLTLPVPVENIIDLCSNVKTSFVKRQAEKSIQEYLQGAQTDPYIAVAGLYQSLGLLQDEANVSNDVSFKERALEEEILRLEEIHTKQGITGMPWPWAKLNLDTGGIHDSDYIMVWALPKSMKTWFGLIIVTHLFKTGRKVLVYSKEMTWANTRSRVASILAEVSYDAVKQGNLSQVEKITYLNSLEDICREDHPGDIIFTNADRLDGSPGGPIEIRRKIEMYQPHFVMLDSSYMLELPNTKMNPLDWKSLSLVNRELKQITKSLNIPILAILQENERSAYKYQKSRGTASLAMNTGAVMDCDLGIRLVRHSKRKELSIHYAAARETEADGFTINAIPCENFQYAHEHLHNIGDDFEDEGGEENRPQVPQPPEQPEESWSLISSYNQPINDEIQEDLEEDE